MAETQIAHDLFEAARGAMACAHAPYSKFPVGVAIRAEDGKIYTGANIENLPDNTRVEILNKYKYENQ